MRAAVRRRRLRLREPGAETAGVEFVCTSVTSNNLKDITGDPTGATSTAVEEGIKANNRHIRYLNFDDHGFSVLDVNAERAQMDWFVIGDRADRNTDATWETSWRTRSAPAGSSRSTARSEAPGDGPHLDRRRTLVTTSAGAVFSTALTPGGATPPPARGRKRAYVLVVDGCQPDEIDADADPDPRRAARRRARLSRGRRRCRSWRPSPTT